MIKKLLNIFSKLRVSPKPRKRRTYNRYPIYRVQDNDAPPICQFIYKDELDKIILKEKSASQLCDGTEDY